MMLRGINFGYCLDAAGVRGWRGEGYWFHHAPGLSWLYNFTGSTFVSKTGTFSPNAGNMPLRGKEYNFDPREWFPKCISFSFPGRRTLNSVGLPGPGTESLLEIGLLSAHEGDGKDYPFMISWASVAKTRTERVEEFRSFVKHLKRALLSSTVLGRIGLQLNFSCPNTGHDTREIIAEAREILDLAAELSIPILVKINLLAPIDVVISIASHETCDGLCFTNAIPFGSMSEIPWKKHYPNGSPLKHFGGGGYSGPDLLPLVAQFGERLRSEGVEKSFNIGGGIRHPDDIDFLCSEVDLRPDRDSVFLGSAAIVCPWNIRLIIQQAFELLGTD